MVKNGVFEAKIENPKNVTFTFYVKDMALFYILCKAWAFGPWTGNPYFLLARPSFQAKKFASTVPLMEW